MTACYNQLFHNNKMWVQKKLIEDKNYFEKLVAGQSPEYLWIGCSDSRVPANEITGTAPGEMFVHRNIANMVVHTDMNLLSVLSYAVEVLKVKHIIVCGHYECGGVNAAMGNKQFGLIDNWLRHIKDVYRLHTEELDNIKDLKLRARKLVELNVTEQVNGLCKTSIIQNAWQNKQDLSIHGWVYDLHDGYLKDLEVTCCNMEELAEVYQFSE